MKFLFVLALAATVAAVASPQFRNRGDIDIGDRFDRFDDRDFGDNRRRRRRVTGGNNLRKNRRGLRP